MFLLENMVMILPSGDVFFLMLNHLATLPETNSSPRLEDDFFFWDGSFAGANC